MGGRSPVPEWLALPRGIFSAIPTTSFFLCSFTVLAALGLGGGTTRGFLTDTILQLLAIPLLVVSLWRIFDLPWTRQLRLAFWLCAAIALLPLLQLVPLPPALWTALPNRHVSAEAFELLGRPLPWMPLSVSPQATWLSALSLIPPIAIFFGTLLLSYRERRALSLVVIAFGIVSVFLGLLQVAQGEQSSLRFFEITNPEEAVGFFANRNHFAALLYCLVPFVVAWTLNKATSGSGKTEARAYDVKAIMAGITGCVALVILFAGEIIARSRAGLSLTLVAVFASMALGFSNRRVGVGLTPTKIVVVAALLIAFTFSLQFGVVRMMARVSDSLQGARTAIALTTIEAARAYMPVGSGLGTFRPVYAMFEKPEDVSLFFVNRAHNDILELWLETGVAGLILLGLFAFWFVRRSIGIWKTSPPAGASTLDWSLVCAATIIVGLLMAHSLVDYPLRTAGIMTMMAIACGFLIEPPFGTQSDEEERGGVGKDKSRRGAMGREPPTSRGSIASSPGSRVPAKSPEELQVALSQISQGGVRKARCGAPGSSAGAAPELTKSPEELQAALNRMQQQQPGMASAAPTPAAAPPIKSPGAPDEMRSGDASAQGRATRTAIPAAPTASQTVAGEQGTSIPPEQRWGADIEWPEAWSKESLDSGDSSDQQSTEPKEPT
jgi:O-antigen ligase